MITQGLPNKRLNVVDLIEQANHTLAMLKVKTAEKKARQLLIAANASKSVYEKTGNYPAAHRKRKQQRASRRRTQKRGV